MCIYRPNQNARVTRQTNKRIYIKGKHYANLFVYLNNVITVQPITMCVYLS